jgi:hypothetical protein
MAPPATMKMWMQIVRNQDGDDAETGPDDEDMDEGDADDDDDDGDESAPARVEHHSNLYSLLFSPLKWRTNPVYLCIYGILCVLN